MNVNLQIGDKNFVNCLLNPHDNLFIDSSKICTRTTDDGHRSKVEAISYIKVKNNETTMQHYVLSTTEIDIESSNSSFEQN